tara:strand:+ start:2401 stop:3987 length:1587 start_codon:yes stop_codon:yes gene_type:complete
MYLILSASKDTYITNKIIDNNFSASNANVGYASTLDLYRLYNESVITGTDKPNELTRLLIKFDYSRIREHMNQTLNINSSKFKCNLNLYDIMGGQLTPTNFNVMLFPLSQSFEEGIGRNVASYNDLGAANFLTSSFIGSTLNKWHLSGANAQGNIDSTAADGYPANIDIIISGNLNDGQGMQALGVSQNFELGTENLTMDVTKIVSATLAGILPDHGFRLSFTGSQEEDTKTRFVKRFASRHVRNAKLRPRLDVIWDDTVIDHHKSFYFDLSGSLFLKNFHRGLPANIVSGSALTEVTGANCMLLTLRTGSFSFTANASQHQAGTRVAHAGGADFINYVTGVYSASFAIPSDDSNFVSWGTTLAEMITRSGSITFDEYWSSADGTVGYYTGSLKIDRINRVAFNVNPMDLNFIITNSKNEYKQHEKALFRVFVRDFNAVYKAKRLPYSLESIFMSDVYYRVKDMNSGEIYIPFETENNGTKLSSDSEGMYFEMTMDLPKGGIYTIEFLHKEAGGNVISQALNTSFKVN